MSKFKEIITSARRSMTDVEDDDDFYDADAIAAAAADNDDEAGRGVQYVHWVMHKCIMVKVEGETKYTESIKKAGEKRGDL